MPEIGETEDAVSDGIRRWQEVKRAGELAIEEARKAQEEAAFYRGQCELMREERKVEQDAMRRLQQHCDEMNIMVESLGAAVLTIVEKRKDGFFRRAGSNLERRPPGNGNLEEEIRGLARTVARPAPELRAAPSGR